MTNIVERLRDAARFLDELEDFPELQIGAAAEITRLREENARLREALAPFVRTLELNCTEADPDDFSSAKKARHVLATYAPPKPLFGR